MNDSLIRTFCETRYRWPTVAGATLLLGCAVLFPLVDEYCDKRTNCNVLTGEIAQARQKARAIDSYRSQLADLDVKLAALEARTVGPAQTGEYRNQIVELARQCNCRIRRIELGASDARPWKEKDRAIDYQGARKDAGAPTSFSLLRNTMAVTVDGAMPNLQTFLKLMVEQKKLVHPHRVELHRASRDGKQVTLQLELWLFTLERTAT